MQAIMPSSKHPKMQSTFANGVFASTQKYKLVELSTSHLDAFSFALFIFSKFTHQNERRKLVLKRFYFFFTFSSKLLSHFCIHLRNVFIKSSLFVLPTFWSHLAVHAKLSLRPNEVKEMEEANKNPQIGLFA